MNRCDTCQSTLKFHFKEPLVLSPELLINLRDLQCYSDDEKKITTIDEYEKYCSVPVNFLRKNWTFYSQQINCFEESGERRIRKSHSNILSPFCICKHYTKTIKAFLQQLATCAKFRDTEFITLNLHKTRILNKIDYSYAILDKYLQKNNLNMVNRLIFKYFSSDNIILHLMYLLRPNTLFSRHIDSHPEFENLNFNSRLCLICKLDSYHEFESTVEKYQNDKEKLLMCLFQFIKLGKKNTVYKMSNYIRYIFNTLDYNGLLLMRIALHANNRFTQKWLEIQNEKSKKYLLEDGGLYAGLGSDGCCTFRAGSCSFAFGDFPINFTPYRHRHVRTFGFNGWPPEIIALYNFYDFFRKKKSKFYD